MAHLLRRSLDQLNKNKECRAEEPPPACGPKQDMNTIFRCDPRKEKMGWWRRSFVTSSVECGNDQSVRLHDIREHQFFMLVQLKPDF